MKNKNTRKFKIATEIISRPVCSCRECSNERETAENILKTSPPVPSQAPESPVEA